MDSKQAQMITKRAIKCPDRQKATLAVLVDGLSVYAAEIKFGITENTLGRNVKRVRDDWAFMTDVITSSGHSDNMSDVVDMACGKVIKRMIYRDGYFYGWF